MRPFIMAAIAALITFGGMDAALSDCIRNLSRVGDLFAPQARSGVIGDHFNPVMDFGENTSLDQYAATFSNPSRCVVSLFTL